MNYRKMGCKKERDKWREEMKTRIFVKREKGGRR